MQIPHKPPFNRGYTPLSPRGGATANMLMDFGVIKLLPGDSYQSNSDTDERVWLLSEGSAKISWEGGEKEISRPNLFDYSPWCLSVPAKNQVTIKAGSEGAEFYYTATDNPKPIKPKLFTPEECKSEFRGEGTMRETSTRVVRTVFDDTNRPESNLVIGEVIGVPGKWSSYPPHHHPQPEIYHYRFLPAHGFGLTAIGDTPYIIKDKDTILIREGEIHPQVTAPGYAMWYLWVIRHIEGAHYGPATNTPIFIEEHKWVMGPQDKIWQPKK
ncbi:myo-inositol catabolism protein [Treponema primitia ZAS-2]|uniref:Myo-inositol catabolism protein n=1 Tax=Treponema primitia (strain ATCC BAA-887 / DSM 12427 / ZAS-2) TaxID=545694 RepID=F5YMA4_TREPZ|nr:5-deoxy-glucuronate isomerase [Treponema primitia]AEF84724.1 myo-inositol catabolism protein [Treponema primitia ZAS-2]